MTPAAAVAPPAPTARQRRARLAVGAVSWTPPDERRRQPDHRLHRHAVHRRDGADAGPGRRVGDEHGRDRARPTGRATRSGSRRRTPSAPAPQSAGLGRGRRRAPRSSTSRRRRSRTAARPERDRGRRQVPRRRRRARSPASASTRPPRTPAPTSAACGREPAARSALRRRSPTRPTSGWQTRDVRQPGRRSPPARPTSRPTSRRTGHYSVTANGVRVRRRQRPLHALGERHEQPTACSPTARRARSRRAASTRRTTGSTCCTPPAGAAGPGHRRAARPPGRRSATCRWTAPGERRRADVLQGHAVHRRDRADADDGHRHAAGDEHDGDAGLTPGTAYTFTVQRDQPRRRRPASRRRPNAVTPLGAGAPGAPTGVSAQADTKSANVSWTAPADDGGSAITRLHGHAVRRARPPARRSTSALGRDPTRVTGLTNGTAYTFTVQADERGRRRARPRRADAAVTAAGVDLRARHAGASSTRATSSAVDLGVKFRSDVAGPITGLRFYKAATQHRHPRRHL